MPMYQSGDLRFSCDGLPAEQALVALEAMREFEGKMADARSLQDINHFHVFGDNRRCRCGLTELQYVFRSRDNMEELICLYARRQYVQTPKEFADQLYRKRRATYINTAATDRDDDSRLHVKNWSRLHGPGRDGHLYAEPGADCFDQAVKLYEEGREFES